MAVKLASLRVDLAREENGDWIASPDIPGVEFNVSSIMLPVYQSALSTMEVNLAKKYKGMPVPINVRTVEVGKLLHKHILHNWRGFDQPYSRELAGEIMSSEDGRNIIAAVQNCAAMISITEPEFIEDAGKNSERPSATT